MRENYYWYEEIPTSKLNYFTKPASAFLKTLVPSKDSYSYIEDPTTDIESLYSYGFQFETSIRYNDTAYAARVLYVDSDSPASGKLKRGDWIIKRNDKYIIKNRIDSLYKGDAITLTLGEYNGYKDENEKIVHSFKDKGTIQLTAARITHDNPIHFGDIVTSTNGKKVGYLVYNRFMQGKDENDITYDNELRSISNTFKSGNLDEVVLDLRYNTGGSLESAQLLANILVPQEAIGKTMCHLKFNDKQSSRNETWTFSNEVLGSGSNLNLSKIYIITGSTTSSASDVLINILKAYMNVTLIGQTTKGNYGGTHAYSNEEEHPGYILHPIDCMIHNAKDELPTSGHAPTHTLNELKEMTIFPFGNKDEIMLYSTLHLIDNGAMPSKDETRNSNH